MLPAYLQLATLLNAPSTRAKALTKLTSGKDDKPPSDVLRPLPPFLTLDTLLHLRSLSSDLDLDLDAQLYALLDGQRDWVVSPECPVELRDAYLVRAFGEGGKAWEGVREGMFLVAEGMKGEVGRGMVLEAKEEDVKKGEVCAGLDKFKEEMKELSSGLLEKVDWSNVVLGGGSVLSVLTGRHKDPEYKDSDFDLFLYGLKPEELIPKVSSIIDQIRASLPPPPKRTQTKYDLETKTYSEVEVPDDDENWLADRYFEWESHHRGELMILKGYNCITLVPPYGLKNRRTIQIVLVSHKSIFDALAGFDLDACAVGFNGKEVVALPRAVRSLSLGGWTAGINLLDIKLARKLDPSSATVSSRALKYLTRGYSLALPAAALEIFFAEDVDLAQAIKAGADKAKNKAEREKTRTEELAGLEGLMRRKYNKAKEIGKIEAQGADYGPAMMAMMKPLEPRNLASYENGEIQHEYWEWNLKFAQQVYELLENDKKDYSKGKEAKSGNVASYDVPYVPGFDKEHLLGMKSADDVTEKYTWSKIRNLQVPRTLLDRVERADDKLKALVSGSTARETPASPAKKAKQAKSVSFSPLDADTAKTALTLLSDLDASAATDSTKQLADSVHPPRQSETNLAPFVPETYPGPLTSERRSFFGMFGGFGGSGAAKGKAKKPDFAEDRESVLAPVRAYDGAEIAVTKKTTPYVYKVATLGGLWMFKGLDDEVDKVRDSIWQAHVLTARAATSLPSGIPLWLLATDKNPYPSASMSMAAVNAAMASAKGKQKEALDRYRAQPSTKEVLDKMKVELGKLEKSVAKKVKAEGMGEVGEWDEERRRWLLQWVRGEEMI
ncbi:hypothetical protein JCM8097_004235 [Rhodosporidiobolus ruineniae]